MEYISKRYKKNNNDNRYSVSVTGDLMFVKDVLEGTVADAKKMDTITIPAAMFVLMLMLQSLRIMAIPIITIAISIGCSFLVMYPIALHHDIASTAPSMMLSIIIAMSIDYSLFLLCRFREEIKKGVDPITAVDIMIQSAGHTVLVSGLTLSCCMFGLMFMPINFISSQGMA